MSRVAVILGAALIGCAQPESTAVAENIDIADFHGFASEAAWSYRDDGIVDEAPEDDELLRTRYVQGSLDFRRGARWADAEQTAVISFYLTDDEFGITDWDLGPSSGSQRLPLTSTTPAEGQTIKASGWSCETNRKVEVETYYGFFPDVIQFDCEGNSGPAGLWTFAKDMGLVSYIGDEYDLSLVAPW